MSENTCHSCQRLWPSGWSPGDFSGEQSVEEIERNAIMKEHIHDKNVEVLVKRKAAKVSEYIVPRKTKNTRSRLRRSVFD